MVVVSHLFLFLCKSFRGRYDSNESHLPLFGTTYFPTAPCLLRYATLFLPHTICCFPPVCLNVVFLSLPPSQAALFRSLSEKRGCRKIISHSASHSVVTGIWAAKKPAHKCVPTHRQKDRLIPLWCWFHIHVTGFEIQSRNCLLRLSVADSSKQFQKRRYFLFAYRRRVRCKAVLPNSVRICNWLWFS